MTDTPARLLDIRNLSVSFGKPPYAVDAVKDVSFHLDAGEVLGIVGESGSGKSVTCRAMFGLLPKTASCGGEALFEGTDLLRLKSAELQKLRGRQASMIFQNPASHLDPLMTVGQHVAEPLLFHFGRSQAQARAECVSLLEQVKIRDARARIDAYPHELSGGMKQRVMIASAIACKPRLLIADEPTTALDVTVQARILDLLRDLNREHGLSIILISHDLGVVAELCDRVAVMRNGEIVEQGATEDVVNRPAHAYTRLLLASQPSVLARDAKTEGDTVDAPTGKQEPVLRISRLDVDFPVQTPIIDLIRLRGRKPPFRAIDDVALEVFDGECLGIVGESGSGKSTVARVVTRLVTPSGGKVVYRGASVLDFDGQELAAFRREVQMVFQNPFDSLNPRLRIFDTLAEPLRKHRLVPADKIRGRVAELMQMVDLAPELLTRHPRQLSGGQCQRVGIARALAMEPRTLIADEITSALDVTVQAQILKLLERLRRQQNLTLIYISHDLEVVRMICDRIAVFQAGHLVEIGTADQVLDRPREDYTRTLIASAPRIAGAAA